jgi:two-component system response regulator PilR (NtrC family)
MQVKLLRAIQEKAVRPVGSNQEIHVDVRILSATHKNLAQLVREGKFREDLYYRINVIELTVPPLRERPEDIPPLVEHVLANLARHLGCEVPRLSDDAMEALQGYAFPGNVRELENILERAITLSEGDAISAEELGLSSSRANGQQEDDHGLDPYLSNIEREAILKALEQTRHNKTAAARVLGISFRALRYRLKKLGME